MKSPRGRATQPAVAPPGRRILLVDDHPMMRAGLAALINSQADLHVAGEAAGPAEALSAIARETPGLVLTDLTMPGRAGVEFIKDALALRAGLPILVVSMHDEMVHAERALKAGARGYVMKEAGGEKLLAAVRRVLEGQVAVSERVAASLLDAMTGRHPRGSSSPIGRLSDREFEVFQLVGRGHSTRDIARHLGLSPKTVDVHRGNIREKLGLANATELVRHAVRWVESGGGGGR